MDKLPESGYYTKLCLEVSPAFYPLSSARVVDSPEEEKTEVESQFDNSVLTNFYINNDTCLNNYNDNFILEYNLIWYNADLALATVVHYGLRSLWVSQAMLWFLVT